MYKYKNLQTDQLPRQHLPVIYLSLNFIITKYFKQKVGHDLSVSADELGPYGFSVTGDGNT